METKMGPSYANLFVGFMENKFFSKAPLHSQLHSYQKAFDMGEAQQALAVNDKKQQRVLAYWKRYLELVYSQLLLATGSQSLRSSGSIDRHVFASS